MIAKQTAMPSQVAEALARLEWLATSKNTHDAINTLRAELHRLTEIAEGVEPLVIRLGEVTTKLEAANKDAVRYRYIRDNNWSGELYPVILMHKNARWDSAIDAAIQSHLKGAGDEA